MINIYLYTMRHMYIYYVLSHYRKYMIGQVHLSRDLLRSLKLCQKNIIRMQDHWIMVNIHINKLSTAPPAMYASRIKQSY